MISAGRRPPARCHGHFPSRRSTDTSPPAAGPPPSTIHSAPFLFEPVMTPVIHTAKEQVRSQRPRATHRGPVKPKIRVPPLSTTRGALHHPTARLSALPAWFDRSGFRGRREGASTGCFAGRPGSPDSFGDPSRRPGLFPPDSERPCRPARPEESFPLWGTRSPVLEDGLSARPPPRGLGTAGPWPLRHHLADEGRHSEEPRAGTKVSAGSASAGNVGAW